LQSSTVAAYGMLTVFEIAPEMKGCTAAIIRMWLSAESARLPVRPQGLAPGRARRPGAGRKPAIAKDPTLISDLEALVEPTTRGDPDWPLRWTCKSVRRLAENLHAQGHQASRTLVGELLSAVSRELPRAAFDPRPD